MLIIFLLIGYLTSIGLLLLGFNMLITKSYVFKGGVAATEDEAVMNAVINILLGLILLILLLRKSFNLRVKKTQ